MYLMGNDEFISDSGCVRLFKHPPDLLLTWLQMRTAVELEIAEI